MNLSEELQRVRGYLSGDYLPPSNEANTCSKVIRPLLHQCGYDHDDIDEQGHDAAGGIPDYILLPHSPHTWFLEAKKWTEILNAVHATQAINYANTQGKQWVVLSNGREWRLYDNFIVGVPPTERLVVTAKLDCEEQVENLLGALSKESVQSGALERYVAQTRLTSLLDEQLRTPNSEVIAAMRTVLKGKFGLSGVTTTEIALYFQAFPKDSVPPLPPAKVLPAPVPAPTLFITPAAIAIGDSLTLSELMSKGTAIRGRKPIELMLPDGKKQPVSSWAELTRNVVEWLLTAGKTPALPFRGRPNGKIYFLSTTPNQVKGKTMKYKEIVMNGQTLYLDLNRSSSDFVQVLNVLCKEVGESPDGFKVTLA